MTYKIRLDKEAGKFYSSADKALKRKLARCFEVLKITPRSHPHIKPLKGKLAGRYRYRLGNYRVVYRIQDETIEVVVLLISPRGKAYD